MGNDNIITWTPTNWITVFLMALGGFLILNLAVKGFKKLSGNSSAPAPATAG